MTRRYRAPILFLVLSLAVIGLALWWPRHSNGYFRPPLDSELQLAAYFGELRENHFHMGLDIRTGGREGMPVYAAADGYVSHCSIQPDGLGNALFVRHGNGLTTVYGHLSRFEEPIAQFTARVQYATKSWEQELDITPDKFPVKKGQLIAYSGNTGASRAPHLHFEIRDSRTGRNINPLLEGFGVGDEIAPSINGLYWYDRRYSTYTTRARKIAITGRGDRYQAADPVVQLGSPLVSFGINATDRNSGSPHISGIYAADLWMDDTLQLSFRLKEMMPSDTRYINACIDYTKWARSGIYVQHLSVLPGNHAPIFSPGGKDGQIRLTDGGIHRVRIRVSDVNGNHSELTMRIQYNGNGVQWASRETAGDTGGTRMVLPGHEASLESPHCRVQFSGNAFYDRLPFRLEERSSGGAGAVSPLIVLQDATVPIHDNYIVEIRSSLRAKDPLRKKTLMQLVSGDSQSLFRGKWEKDWMMGSFSRLGTVRLLVDTTAPELGAEGWADGQTLASDQPVLNLVATDDLGVIARFEGELDGRWVPFAQKGSRYSYAFDAACRRGAHRLLVTVTDLAGNQTRKQFRFVK